MLQVTMPKIFQPYECEDLVRYGKDHDGGYLINSKDVDKTDTLLSFGIGEDVSFEKDFTSNKDCPVLAYDNSVDGIHEEFFVGNKKHIKKNVGEEIYFDEILEQAEGNVFLKCDIEGSEYQILYDILQNSKRFSGIAIEFHDIQNHNLFNELTNFISKIDLKLIHIHANNYAHYRQGNEIRPAVIELSFSSSPENLELNPHYRLPHALDMSNDPNGDDFQLMF